MKDFLKKFPIAHPREEKEPNYPDPVDCLGGQWGFWDETWSNWHAPYENEAAARQALADYANWLENGY